MSNYKLKNPVRIDAFVEAEAKEELKRMSTESKGVSMSDIIREAIDEFLQRTTEPSIDKRVPRDVRNALDVIEYIYEPMKGHTTKKIQTISMKPSTISLIINTTDFGVVLSAVKMVANILTFKGVPCMFIYNDSDKLNKEFIIEFNEPINYLAIRRVLEESKSDYEKYGKLMGGKP